MATTTNPLLDLGAVALLLEARDWARTGRAKQLRVAAGLAQTEVARQIGVDASCVSRWENGQRRPSGEPAIRWSRFLRDLAGYLQNEHDPGRHPRVAQKADAGGPHDGT